VLLGWTCVLDRTLGVVNCTLGSINHTRACLTSTTVQLSCTDGLHVDVYVLEHKTFMIERIRA
jgi:hypothetical protein